ncbi:hypothetical protein Cgig2_015725 [Carnegiea gigantea]|uniref:Uncharacterized protein n=1 Tax=Carnegiea gigantea TaxID=171969 RepID=A0A9Q1GUY4_9CARY|nr:hypothetical protein Cgig2_015725 [Carnegiea gigantea]
MTEDVSEMADYNWYQVVLSFLVKAIQETKEKIPMKKNLQMHGFTMILQVWFYEHTNLYAHADEKCVSRTASRVNLYIGCKYDAAQIISSIKDNQIVPVLKVRELERRETIVKAFSETDDFNTYVKDALDIISIEERLRRMKEALQTEKEALRLEKEAHDATKKELKHMRALLIGRGWGDSVPQGTQIEGVKLTHGVEGSADTTDARIITSEGDDSHMLCTKLHAAEVVRAEDVRDREPLGDGMSHEGEMKWMTLLMPQGKMWYLGWSATYNQQMTLVKRGRRTTLVR